MKSTVSAMDARLRFGDLLNRVALLHEEITIERQGRPMAVLMPVEVVERLRSLGKAAALEPLAREDGPDLGEEEALALALEATAAVRRPRP